MNHFILIFISFLVLGCASSPPQYSKLINQSNIMPKRHQIQNVPFILQKEAFCGPATMSMALNYYGENLTQNDLAPNSNIEKNKGTFNSDMLLIARKYGYLTPKVDTLEDLFKELEHNHPVIVFQNLGFDWFPLWHYSILIGYDIERMLVYMHSGEEISKEMPIDQFERTWMRGNYWAIAPIKAGELSATGSEFDHIKSAASFESNNQHILALKSYLKVLEKWPMSFMANIGAGNIYFKQRKYQEAIKYYNQALMIKPKHPAALKNKKLALNYFQNSLH